MSHSRRIVRTATSVVAAGIVLGVAHGATAQTTTTRVQPLGVRQGVIVGYRAQSSTVIVAVPSGKMKAIHALRSGRTGTRVRIRGIKWGAPISGIKWGRAPSGIKWGIKWGLNGTLSSPLDRIGSSSTVRIRGVVLTRSRTAIAIATTGGIVTIITPMGLPAVTGSLRPHATAAPRLGSIVTVPVRIRGGMLTSSAPVRVIGSVATIPVSGAITAISTTRRTITIDGTSDPVLPVEMTMAAPSTMNIAALSVGDEVVAIALRDASGALKAASIGRNETFAAANDPALQLVAPAGARPETVGLTTGLVNQVDAAVFVGQISGATATSATTQIRAVRTLAQDGDFPGAISALDAFIATIDTGRADRTVDPQTANRLRRLADDLKARLQDPALR
ncbi:MAG TPA: hypothetical protein PLV41_03955 [Miltoncostaeales bacterium]|nr:hypothetical protein [Miltoncostaeales bacterium]